MITDNTTYKGRTLGQWVEMAQRGEAEIVRLAGELSEKVGAPDLHGAKDEQAAFEEWARKRFLIGRTGYSPSGEEAWKAWQARAHIAQRAASGELPPFGWFDTTKNIDGSVSVFSVRKEVEGAFPLFAAPAPIADEVAGEQSGGIDAHS